METERREQMQRMLAMAGIGPGVDQDALRAAGIDASEQGERHECVRLSRVDEHTRCAVARLDRGPPLRSGGV